MGAGRPKRETLQIAKEEGKKRGRGRPRKDEVVIKPIVTHKRPDIKEENKLKYAQDIIKRADNLCKRYERPYPNPLNIDEKDLLPEARAAWEYVFSLRTEKLPSSEIRHRPRKLETPEEILILFDCFNQYIQDHNFVTSFIRPDGEEGTMPLVPNDVTFARWLGVGYGDVYDMMERSTEFVRRQYRRILSNTLSQGAIIGAYQQSSAIFTLKNMCDWADKVEDRITKQDESLGVDEALKLMSDLGYTKKLDELKSLDKLQAPKENSDGQTP